MPSSKKIVFSGIQPTGNLHIGNYVGAIKLWVQEQDLHENIFCIVDLHAITTPDSLRPKELRKNVKEMAALYLAAGIDPKKSIIFVQSEVPAHAELSWILNCVTPVSWLQKMTQYKSKAGKQKTVGAGLLNYPVLMAADILLYGTNLVPVGEDQKQHVEITRDIAKRFNAMFGKTFVVPRVVLRKSGARLMGLDNPLQKMSKSDGVKKKEHAIFLLDEPEVIRKKIARAVTDNKKETRFEKASPGVKNLLVIYEVFTGKSRKEIEKHFAGKGYGFLKQEVAEAVIKELQPLQERYRKILQEKKYLENVLKQGREKVLKMSEKTLNKVKKRMGLK